MPPKEYVTISYGGITRIRFVGRRTYLPLSLLAQAPHNLDTLYYCDLKNARLIHYTIKNVKRAPCFIALLVGSSPIRVKLPPHSIYKCKY